MKQAIQEQLGIDVDIERAHRVERRNRDRSSQDTQQGKSRTIVSFAAGNKEKQSFRKLGKASQVVFSFPKTWPSLHYKGELHK